MLTAIVAAGSIVPFACRTATEVTIEITTRAKCTDMKGVTIVVAGDPESAEGRASFPTTHTEDCTPTGDTSGRIGTLVVTPGGDTGAVIVIGGFTTKALDCKPPGYKGCIVARRLFSFSSHAQATLPIVLDPDCVDVPCNATSTCVAKACVRSDVDCSSETCSTPDAQATVDATTPPPPPAGDDGPPIVDGGPDGAKDATGDGPFEAGVPDGGGPLPNCSPTPRRCPPTNITVCAVPPPAACCYPADGLGSPSCGTVGSCSAVEACCEGANDCGGAPNFACCANRMNPAAPTKIACGAIIECGMAAGGPVVAVCTQISVGPSPQCPFSQQCGPAVYVGPYYRCN